jgi:predicted TIM-barrel fold metal-dependent hydrolase
MRCDCHVHIVGPAERYPQIPSRTYLAQPAPLETLRRRGAMRGITCFVLVQPSFYGTDNTLLLESLDSLGNQGRGVAVVDAAKTTPDRLIALRRRGVRGLRLNLYSSRAGRAVVRLDDAFSALAGLAKTMRWHVEVITSIAVMVQNAELLARAEVPVVIDHYGVFGRVRPTGEEGRRLLALLRLAHVWMKLSAPYRVGENPTNTRPDKEWLEAILACAADRCVWGSDWPHTPRQELQGDATIALPYRNLSYPALVDDFITAVGSTARADKIMRDNAARLYGFESMSGTAESAYHSRTR